MAASSTTAALAAALVAAAAACAVAAPPPVEHVVVLMLENRSFDHMLGFLKRNDSRVDGCLPGLPHCSNPEDPLAPGSPAVSVSPNAIYKQVADPDHAYDATYRQVYGDRLPPADPGAVTAPMSGFVSSYFNRTKDGDDIMACFDPRHVPAIATLASEFALLDRYYSGVPGPTEVNRLMAMSATSNGSAANDKLRLAFGYPQRSIFQNVDESSHNRTWGVFFDLFPTALFLDYVRRPANWHKLHTLSTFYKQAAAGTLPSFSWLEPRYYDVFGQPANDQHPDHDVALGDQLIKSVYEAVRAGPGWNRTMLIVTYDEHGGFFDSVPPPAEGVPSPDGIEANDVTPPFNFDRLGVRVPAVVVSPLVPRGIVAGEPAKNHYSHGSLSATVRQLLTPDQAFLTKRDAWSAPLGGLLSLDTPRTDCPETLPAAALHRGVTPGLMPEHLIGTRPTHGFQDSMIAVASALNGSPVPRGTASDAGALSEHEAAHFVAGELNRFLRRPVTDMAATFGFAP